MTGRLSKKLKFKRLCVINDFKINPKKSRAGDNKNFARACFNNGIFIL